MCGSRDTFASKGPQVVKWFAGGAPVKPNDVRWISGAEFKRAFPSEARGFSYDFMKLIPVVDNRDYAVGSIGSSVRPITRRVIFVDTDKPTKCGAMCRNAKGPMCDCSCKGENHGASVAMSRARFAELDLKPTAEMAANAARGLELREKHGKGGTAVGVARARDIKNRANLSPSTVRRMHSFFSRHEGNQKGGEDDAGYIAWLLWGGDAGKAWAARKSEQLDKSESARFATPKVDLDYVRGVGEDYGRRAAKRGINRLIDDREALSRVKLLKYALDPMSPMRDKIDRAFDAGWLRGLTLLKISDVEHPPKFKIGDRVVHDIGTSKHIGKVVRVLAYTEPEPQYLVEFTTLPTGTPRRNISESSLQKSEHTRSRFSHDIRLPKGKRRLNIDEAHAALAQMGYKLGTVRYDPAAGGSVYKVTQPKGSVIDMPAAKLTDFIYEKAKHMKSGTKAAMSHIVGITGNPYEPNAVGTHRFKVGDKVKTDSVVPMYGKIVRLVRNNYGYPAYVVDVLGREPTDTEPRNRNQWDEGHIVRASRAGAKAAFAHPDDAQITSTQLIRGNGRKYEILSRKPASAEARAQLGQTDWLDIRGANGAQYIVQVFNNGTYRVLSSGGKAWQGRILASRAGAKAAFADAKSFRDLVAYARFKFNVNAYQAQDIAGRAGIYMQMNPKVPIEKAMDEAYRRSNAVLSAEQKAPNYTVGGGIGRRDPSLINSRAGAKATMAKFKVGDRIAYKPYPMDTAGEIVEIKQKRAVGDVQRRGSLDMLENEYGVRQSNGSIMWISEGMAVKSSRAGAKAAFARDIKVRKGNFTDTVAIVGQNGSDPANWYAGLILRHKDGEEQVLWMKHGYKNEATAQKYALQKFDAHVSRMSRAGAKAAFSIDTVKTAAAQVAKAYGAGADSAVIRKYLDRIVSVLSGNAEGGQREALGIHAQIGGIAEKTHGRDFMWSQPMQNLEKAIRSAGQFSRAGAKAAFAHPSWSAGLLGKETAPQLAAYSWIDAHLGINGHRTQMLLADIAAEVHARNPALSIQQAIMKAAQEMVQKGVATYDIRALVEDKGWMSRAGAKSTHAAPRPKFNLGDKVAIMDGARVLDTGVIDYAYGYDDFQETYKYKVSTESGARKTWNEGSLKKMSRAGAKAAFSAPTLDEVLRIAKQMSEQGNEAAAKTLLESWFREHGKGGTQSKASRAGAKSTHATDNMYYTVAAHIGDQPAGERTTKSLDEAKAYAKSMLAALKPNAKGKPLVVDVYPVVNYSPQAPVLSLKASRTSADSNRLTLAQRIAVEHDAKRMALR